MEVEQEQQPDLVVDDDTSSLNGDKEQTQNEEIEEDGEVNNVGKHLEYQQDATNEPVLEETDDVVEKASRTSLVIERVPSQTTKMTEEEEGNVSQSQNYNKDDDNNVTQLSESQRNNNNQRRRGIRMRLSENHPLYKFVKDVLLPKFKQVASRMEDASEAAWDRISQANDRFSAKMKEFDRYRPWETMRILLGLLLMLFGHKFRVTFAIIEALRHGGSDELMGNIRALQDQVHAIRTAHKQDKLVDEDNGEFFII